MRTFRDHLQDKLQDERFNDVFDEAKEVVRIGIQVSEARAKLGISQDDLARRVQVTPQQDSMVENGTNCNVLTLLKICRVLSLKCRPNAAA